MAVSSLRQPGNCSSCTPRGLAVSRQVPPGFPAAKRRIRVASAAESAARWVHGSVTLHSDKTRLSTRLWGGPGTLRAVGVHAAAAADAPVDDGGMTRQILAGITVSLAMVPEALAFTFVAGVPPLVGIQTAAVMCAMCAAVGAQPGVISGAAGATAVVYGPLVASHGIEYLFAAVLLSGILQVAAGLGRLGKFIRLVPQPVMLGFVNGLALVIGSAQLEQFKSGGSWLAGPELYTMIGLTALTIALIKAVPKITKAIPAPLAAILSVTALVNTAGIKTRTVGDLASLVGGVPMPRMPDVPLSLDTLWLILPVALAAGAVGLIETLLTQQLVDDITERRTATHTECIGQGVAQIASGILGGMGGCAMIGQSMINVGAGGRTRLSGFACAAALGTFAIAGGSLVGGMPLAALVGTMLCLVVDIFDWTTFRRLRQMPKVDSTVLLLVTGVTLATNLAVAVAGGIVLSSLGFAWKCAIRGITAPCTLSGTTAVYQLRGPLFFGSVMAFKDLFSEPVADTASEVVLDFMESRVWDSSALEAVNEVAARFEAEGKSVRLRHLSPDCRKLLSKAGDMVEVNVEEDPSYGVATDYD